MRKTYAVQAALRRMRARRGTCDGLVDYVFGVLRRGFGPLTAAIGGLGHRIMEARHMRGIERRAERTQTKASNG